MCSIYALPLPSGSQQTTPQDTRGDTRTPETIYDTEDNEFQFSPLPGQNMLVCADLRPCTDQDELAFRRRALRDAVICIGWLKLTSIICYIILYFLVHANSKGSMSNVIQIMLLSVIPFIILTGVLLFLGALEEKVCALEIGLWLCLTIAAYNTVLGAIGGIYFIRKGYLTLHFFLAVIFGVLAISIFTVICHDILIIYAYKNLLRSGGHCC